MLLKHTVSTLQGVYLYDTQGNYRSIISAQDFLSVNVANKKHTYSLLQGEDKHVYQRVETGKSCFLLSSENCCRLLINWLHHAVVCCRFAVVCCVKLFFRCIQNSIAVMMLQILQNMLPVNASNAITTSCILL